MLLDILTALQCQHSSLYEEERWSQFMCEHKQGGSHPLFSGEKLGKTSPAGFSRLLAVQWSETLASQAHTHTQRNVHIHGSLIVVLLLSCCVSVHSELAVHFSSHPTTLPPPSPQNLPLFSLPLFPTGSFSRHLTLTFSPLAPIPPSYPLSHLSPPVFIWCARWCVMNRVAVDWWLEVWTDTWSWHCLTMWECVTCSKFDFQGGCCPCRMSTIMTVCTIVLVSVSFHFVSPVCCCYT